MPGHNAKYDKPRHRAERRKWQAKFDRGMTVRCSCTRPECTHHDGRCPTILGAGSDWDMGHNDDGVTYSGPECVPCNRSAGGRNGADSTNGKRSTTWLDW